MLVGEKRRIGGEIVSVRTEVIVDHVEKHRHATLMGGVNQRLEIFRPSIAALRRIR
ncbi:hypothetical protein D3C87_2161990 [compost metagenome]